METEERTTHAHDRIVKKVLVHAPRDRVWRAITDPQEFGAWFGVKIDGPFAQGAKVKGTIVRTTVDPEVAKQQAEFEGLPFDLEIDRVQPERLFSFRWHPFAIDRTVDYSGEPRTRVSFEIDEKPDGVLVTIAESGFEGLPPARRDKAFEANDQGWAKQAELLEKYLAQP
jgi:uncharacterized protein YndB with AHSA1/START domain